MYINIVGEINGNVNADTSNVLNIVSSGELKLPDSDEIQLNHK
jgi:hypothetical protein